MPWRKNKKREQDAGAGDCHDTGEIQPPAQQTDPDNTPQGSEEDSDRRDDLQENESIRVEGPKPSQPPWADHAPPTLTDYLDEQGPLPEQDQGPPPRTGYQGQPAQTGRHDETPRTPYQQQDVTGDAGVQPTGPTPPSTFTPGSPRISEGMPSEHAAGRHAMPPGTGTEAPKRPDGALAGTASDGGGRVSGPDQSAPSPSSDPAPGGGYAAAAPAAQTRPHIALTTQPAVTDSADTVPRAFPEPLVIGGLPTLRSDPRGLPRPDQVPGPVVPDSVLDGADLDGLLIRGASLRGDSHRYNATVRQDSMGMWRVGDSETTAVLACVTDGVSSEPLSHRGAAEACRMLPDMIARDVSAFFQASIKRRVSSLWEDIAEEICSRLNTVASYLGVPSKALSTTMAAALIELNPPDPGRRRFVILNVGDATGFLLSELVFVSLLADPHDATITSTATYALPTSIGEVGVKGGFIAPGDMLMVCTDGMSNPMRNDDVRDQLAEWWGYGRVPSMLEFGWQMSYRVKSYADDRTAVCVWGQ